MHAGVRPRRAAACGALALLACLTAAGTSSAQVSPQREVLAGHTMSGLGIPCVDHETGVRTCTGDTSSGDLRLVSFDGQPLGVYVTLPAASDAGAEGGYPLIVQNHGWGLPTQGYDDVQYGGTSALRWASKGYMVVQFDARGWGESCGRYESRVVDPEACAEGWVRIDDMRYEARDVQHAVGLLVDEGLVDPARIGMTGESYGAGVSLMLATLKDRVALEDGSFVPWVSPAGVPLQVAAAAPFAGWSDFAYSFAPTGHQLDHEVFAPEDAYSVDFVGVAKASFMTGLYASSIGNQGYVSPRGVYPEADLTGWYLTSMAGEPYGRPEDADMILNLTKYRSPIYLLAGEYDLPQTAPAPIFMSNGFTDDLFPANEVRRYENLLNELYPDVPMSTMFANIGHQRGANRPEDADVHRLGPRIEAFMDHFVGGFAPRPFIGVVTVTQECRDGIPPVAYQAESWEALQNGTPVVFESADSQTLAFVGDDPTVGQTFDPAFGGLACATTPADDQPAGLVATYRLPPAEGDGFTMVGAPTITADIALTGVEGYIAGRLLDVDPATGTQELISRGVYRIDPTNPVDTVTFQLFANAHTFREGHVAKLELLGVDAPFLRPSNFPFQVEVSDLTLSLPTTVLAPEPPVAAVDATPAAPNVGPGQGTDTPAPAPALPVTGGGAAVLGLAVLQVVGLIRRRQR